MLALALSQAEPPTPAWPQRSITQIVPSGAAVTLAVEPHTRPSGSLPKSTPASKGLGALFGAPSRDLPGSFTGYWSLGKIGSLSRGFGASRPTAAGGTQV